VAGEDLYGYLQPVPSSADQFWRMYIYPPLFALLRTGWWNLAMLAPLCGLLALWWLMVRLCLDTSGSARTDLERGDYQQQWVRRGRRGRVALTRGGAGSGGGG
jgi:hypothetical protein